MSRTINGNTMQEVLLKLSKSEKPKYLQGKYPYFPIDAYYNRLRSVIGLEHYTEELIYKEYITIGNGQQLFSAVCKITLLDDNFTPILSKTGIGGVEVHYNDEGVLAGLKNIENNAYLLAFKAAWHKLNIFGIRDLDHVDSENSSYKERPHDTGSTSSTTPRESRQNDTLWLSLDGPFTEARTDKQTGKPVYVVRAKQFNTQNQYRVVDVIFYPNQYTKALDEFNRLLANQSTKPRIHIIASESGAKENVTQLVFKGFAA